MPIPNIVQFTASTPNISSLKYQNFYLGVQDQNYGPTPSTGFWNGITVPDGGWVLYLDKATQGPAIYVITGITDGFELSQSIWGPLPIPSPTFYNYLTNRWDLSNQVFLNKNYENIITQNLYLFFDVGFYLCNPLTGGTPSVIKNITTPNLDLYSSNNIGNTALVDSTNGGILVFDGVNDQLFIFDFNFNTHLRFTSDVTYEFFIKFKDLTGSTSQIYYKSPLHEGVLSANTSNKLVYSYGNGSNSQSLETTSTLTNNTWYHIVLVRDFSNTQKIYWYINGTEDRNVATTYSSASSSSNSTYFMTDGSTDWTFADVGIIRVYNSALTSSQVSQNFNAQKSRFGL